jgi:hypothetical protein
MVIYTTFQNLKSLKTLSQKIKQETKVMSNIVHIEPISGYLLLWDNTFLLLMETDLHFYRQPSIKIYECLKDTVFNKKGDIKPNVMFNI